VPLIQGACAGNAFDPSLQILGVWTLVSGGFLVAGRGRHRPSFTVVGLASAAGLTGAIAGLLVGFSVQGTFLGSNHLATRWMLVGAGIGWIAGAVIGMSDTKGSRTADRGEIVVLGLAASVSLLSAVFVATWLMVPEFFCVDGAIYTDLATVERLRWVIVIDGAIASTICVVQMLRGNVRGGIIRSSEAPAG
jgi:hypothetical protein